MSKHNHTWNLKRHEQAGKAANAFLKQHYCLIITYGKAPTKGDDGVHELEEDTGQEPSDPRGTRVHLCFVQPGCAEHVAKQLLGVLWIMRVVNGPGPEPHGCGGHASVCVHEQPTRPVQPVGRGQLHQLWLADGNPTLGTTALWCSMAA